MALLVHLVTNRVLGSGSTGTEGGVGVFGRLLVGLGGSLRGRTLDGFGDVVGGVPDRTKLCE